MKKTVEAAVKKLDRPAYVTEIMEDDKIPAKLKWYYIVLSGLKNGAYNTDEELNEIEHVFPTDTVEEAQKKLDLIEENIDTIKDAASSRALLITFSDHCKHAQTKREVERKIGMFNMWLEKKLSYRPSGEFLFDHAGRFRYQRAETIIREEWKEEYSRAAEVRNAKITEKNALKKR